MKFTIKLETTCEGVVAKCKELDVNVLGSTDQQALERMKKVIDFYVNSVDLIDNKVEEVLQ